MLNVQQFLKDKTLDDLTKELSIKIKRHDTLPLAILNYDQLESPKLHPVARECRGLVLHTETHEVVARSFPRFFNWGEVQQETYLFDFTDFVVQSKEDGSLCLLFFFDGQWRVTTRASFATDTINFSPYTWEEGICKALKVKRIKDLELDTTLTYVCEFCSPWNKVVRNYPQSVMYLLTSFRGLAELGWGEVESLAGNFLRPNLYRFSSVEDIYRFLVEQSSVDPTFEGMVIRDRHNHRWKIKSPSYLALHRIGSCKESLFNPKNLLPFILAGEADELLCYFGEVEDFYWKCKAIVDEAFANLLLVWQSSKAIADQKAFALAILGKTPFTGILFELRKRLGMSQTINDLRDAWKNSPDVILKNLFHNKEIFRQ